MLRRAITLVLIFALSLGLTWALIDLTSADPPDPVPSIVLREGDDDEDEPDDEPRNDGQTRTRTRGGAATASPPPPPPAGGGPAPAPAGDDTFDTATDVTD
jgi:hypothetical protein